MTKVIITIVISVVVIISAIFYTSQPESSDLVACTLEAKICPDGSSVSRVGSDCQFAPCPEVEEEVITENGTSVSLEKSSSIYRCTSYYIETPSPLLADADTKIYDIDGDTIISCGGYKDYVSEEARKAEEQECALYSLTDECVRVESLP